MHAHSLHTGDVANTALEELQKNRNVMGPVTTLLFKFPSMGVTTLEELATFRGSRRVLKTRFPDLVKPTNTKGPAPLAFRRHIIQSMLCHDPNKAVPLNMLQAVAKEFFSISMDDHLTSKVVTSCAATDINTHG